uniref:Uncharacterized protein n=1 Tax=Helianthus annuus TaxID=4232 RepID=A0A251UKN2_HELAN
MNIFEETPNFLFDFTTAEIENYYRWNICFHDLILFTKYLNLRVQLIVLCHQLEAHAPDRLANPFLIPEVIQGVYSMECGV